MDEVVASPTVARVLPDVSGLDKEFDYYVPDRIGAVQLGDVVRVELHGRRIGGWVVALDPPEVKTVPLDVVIASMRTVELDGDTIQTARDLGVCLGDEWEERGVY